MGANRDRAERCGTCRFWDAGETECHRHAPVVAELGLPVPGGATEATEATEQTPIPCSRSAAGRWPRTPADGWCGEWCGPADDRATATPVPPTRTVTEIADVAITAFLGRVAPCLETGNPASLVESLLNQLPADVRRVMVRVNGLDGQPVEGVREIAKEGKMTREHVRSLLAIGEKRVGEIVGRLVARQLAQSDQRPRTLRVAED